MTTFNTKQVMLTPELSKQFLARNTRNRSLSDMTVRLYADAMRRGEWKLNGEPIIFGKSMRMLDGQHRCYAVIKSGGSVPALVIEGVDDDVFDTIGSGKKRNAADVLSIRGAKNVNVLASGARAILRIGSHNGSWAFSPTQIAKCVDDFPRVEEWASVYASSKNMKRVAPSLLIGVITLAEHMHGSLPCYAFMEKIGSGAGLSENDPAYQLRERYISRGNGQRYTQDYGLAVCIKAVNAAMHNKSISTLRWGERESMPVLL